MLRELGDKIKAHESEESDRRLDINLPIYIRLDGHGFSQFTRGMRKPFDERVAACMDSATRELVRVTNARIGYTQSDEISLVLLRPEDNPAAGIYFSAKILKLASTLAGLATARFMLEMFHQDAGFWEAYAERCPHFDCRLHNLPDRAGAVGALAWREADATINAISAAAQESFGAKNLHGVSTAEMRRRLEDIGIRFDREFPVRFRRGVYFRRVVRERPMTPQEVAWLPPERRLLAAAGDVLVVRRSSIEPIEAPPIASLANSEEFVFDGAEPVIGARTEEKVHV